MPRQARLDAAGILHHVMARGIEENLIFRDGYDKDSRIDTKEIEQWSKKYVSLIGNVPYVVPRSLCRPGETVFRIKGLE